MRRATWRCKVCRTWGVGGPKAAVEHVKDAHAEPTTHATAAVSVGFIPNYAAGVERWPWLRPVHARSPE